MTDQRRREGAKSNHQTWGIWFILQFGKILRSHSESVESTDSGPGVCRGAEWDSFCCLAHTAGSLSTFYTSTLLVMQSSSEASEEAMGSDPESRERPLFHPEVEIHALLGLWDSDSVALLHHSTSFPQITIQTTWATADCGENTQTRSSAWPMPAVVFISFISRHDYYRLNHLYKQVSKGNLLEVSVTISLFQLAI